MSSTGQPIRDASVQHKLEQASAAFRDVAAMLAELRGQLLVHGFSSEASEDITAMFAAKWLDDV